MVFWLYHHDTFFIFTPFLVISFPQNVHNLHFFMPRCLIYALLSPCMVPRCPLFMRVVTSVLNGLTCNTHVLWSVSSSLVEHHFCQSFALLNRCPLSNIYVAYHCHACAPWMPSWACLSSSFWSITTTTSFTLHTTFLTQSMTTHYTRHSGLHECTIPA